MNPTASVPQIAPLLPIGRENAWSDLLAALIATDPEPARALLALPPGHITVQREQATGKSTRPDLLVYVDDALHTVIEAKVLAGLGTRQLERYLESTTHARQHVLTYLETLPLHIHSDAWRPVTWEEWARAYSASSHPWCAHTAAGWTAHVARAVPTVNADTRWHELAEGIPFAISIRARVAWLHGAVRPRADIDVRLATSASGDSAILELCAETPEPGYRIECNIEEGLDVRYWPTSPRTGDDVPSKGPRISIQLVQYDVTTSRDYQWNYLAALWPELEQSGIAWQTRAPSTRVDHDKAGVQTLVDSGVPRFVGRGFGDKMAVKERYCAFGPVCHLPADSTLSDVATFLDRCADLVASLSKTKPPR